MCPRGRKEDNDDDERRRAEHNPFVAFRRFADDHINTAMRGLGDIPNMFGDVLKSFEDAEQDARAMWKRFEDNYERTMNPERKRLEGKPTMHSPNDEAKGQQRKEHSFSNWAHQFADDPDFGSYFYHPYSPLVLESTSVLQQSPVNWRGAFEDLIKAQDGKPLTDDSRKQEGKHWTFCRKRRVLADGQQWTESLKQQGLMKHGFFAPGEPWASGELNTPMKSMAIDLLYGGTWARFERPRSTSDHKQESHRSSSHGPETELDMYEQFLGRQVRSTSSTPPEVSSSALIPSSQSQTHPEQQTSFSASSFSSSSEQHLPAQNADGKQLPSVISTMTTTERHMQSDGTVTTKTVLKKKFSDGTEHSEESTNTAQIPASELRGWPEPPVSKLLGSGVGMEHWRRRDMWDQQQQDKASEEQKAPKQAEGREKKGWFWSS